MWDLIVIVVLLGLGYGFGRWAEQRHYQSIFRREKMLRKILLIASKRPPEDMAIKEACLVTGSVVISIDYFKRFLATLRNLVGGRVRTYETLLDRARRESILRMKEQARKIGATMIFNVKFETSSISKGSKDAIGSVEVLSYGTALVPTTKGVANSAI